MPVKKFQTVDGKKQNYLQENNNIKIGVLALQGAFREHIASIRKCGFSAIEIRFPHQLDDIDGLIIPGGESTTIIKLVDKYDFKPALKKFHRKQKPVFGTCAGLILLAKKVAGYDFGLGFIDITVQRNAYGRQIDSFEQHVMFDYENSQNQEEFKAVFIRAPKITAAGKNVQILSSLNGNTVLAKEENIMVCTFHPELTDDLRIHRLFIDMVKKSVNMVKSK